MPKVSVIVPVYNSEKYLEQCLDSILAQTFEDYELICVDDGSADSSSQILEDYSAKDARVMVLTQENSHAGIARNTGMKHASGDYLVFWDSDDYFSERALETMFELCERDDADLCLCGGRRYYDPFGVEAPARSYLKEQFLPPQIPFSRKDCEESILNITTATVWNKMFSRSFVESNGLSFSALVNAEDVAFVETALALANRITFTSEPLVCHRVMAEGGLFSSLSSHPLDQIRGWSDARKSLEAHDALPVDSFMRKAAGAVFSLLFNLDDWGAFEQSFACLKEGGLHELMLDDLRDEDFYSARWHREYLARIIEGEPEEFLAAFMHLAYQLSRRANARRDQARDRSRRMQDKIEKLDERNDRLNERIDLLNGRNDRLHERIDRLNERNERLGEKNDHTTEVLRKREERIAHLEETLASVREKRDDEKAARERAEAELAEIKSSKIYRMTHRS